MASGAHLIQQCTIFLQLGRIKIRLLSYHKQAIPEFICNHTVRTFSGGLGKAIVARLEFDYWQSEPDSELI